jgi:hypothetical protein
LPLGAAFASSFAAAFDNPVTPGAARPTRNLPRR